MTTSVPPPDISVRPLQCSVDCTLAASPSAVYQAWTAHLDAWLAAPGTVLLTPMVNTAFYFETHHGDADRQPYYGRILGLEQDRVIELVWLSTGTERAETILTIELAPSGSGTQVQLTHAGFPSEVLRDAHAQAWPLILALIDQAWPT